MDTRAADLRWITELTVKPRAARPPEKIDKGGIVETVIVIVRYTFVSITKHILSLLGSAAAGGAGCPQESAPSQNPGYRRR